ncbi:MULTISPECIES: farnesyl diphosphate synthase [unclassified Lysobacter]|uniref:polyprenyl synthetase family protein n=1 Tax=unclassified Lysobacter TaxID=2635362 RepID=UPI0006FEF231|nr:MULTISPECIES: farnesyl diphosphate synthase [unclassified Lysobacter]KQZ59899.1 geranyl transferase [Lysobacter sp. Root559]KRC38349.1 geranyl transferase [Lysobacter sp. Root76]KRD71532.1 geranyl transferase [Lysobacter sp. Root96]
MRDPRLVVWRERADAALVRALPAPDSPPQDLHAAMRHAVLLGGKRLRPLLVYAAGALFDADEAALDAPAAAVELIHAYSLVHDDLPAMDDDALRRGQPTVHVAYDEATAILAGDALQSLAFAVLANARTDDGVRVALLGTLAHAAGAAGMCGGQALDVAATGGGASLDLAALERLHSLKTGALIRAAVRMGALCGGADAQALTALDRYAHALGLAFQVRDDILDIEGSSATLGKTAGKDAAQDKATFPALIGLDGSRARLDALVRSMHEALAPFGEKAAVLTELGEFAAQRNH